MERARPERASNPATSHAGIQRLKLQVARRRESWRSWFIRLAMVVLSPVPPPRRQGLGHTGWLPGSGCLDARRFSLRFIRADGFGDVAVGRDGICVNRCSACSLGKKFERCRTIFRNRIWDVFVVTESFHLFQKDFSGIVRHYFQKSFRTGVLGEAGVTPRSLERAGLRATAGGSPGSAWAATRLLSVGRYRASGGPGHQQ